MRYVKYTSNKISIILGTVCTYLTMISIVKVKDASHILTARDVCVDERCRWIYSNLYFLAFDFPNQLLCPRRLEYSNNERWIRQIIFLSKQLDKRNHTT